MGNQCGLGEAGRNLRRLTKGDFRKHATKAALHQGATADHHETHQ
jgi:hypothetical protein